VTPRTHESGSEERRRSTALLLADAIKYTEGHSLKANVLIGVLTKIATAAEFTEEMETQALDDLLYAGYKITPDFDAKRWEDVARSLRVTQTCPSSWRRCGN
jgi:hypothetical protein